VVAEEKESKPLTIYPNKNESKIDFLARVQVIADKEGRKVYKIPGNTKESPKLGIRAVILIKKLTTDEKST
jgi:hypothetical protein